MRTAGSSSRSVHGARVVGTVEVLEHRADHPRLERAVGVAQHQGEQAVLGAHDVAHGGVLLEHADAADPPVEPLAALHQPVHVPRHVRAVEVAETEVDDSDGCRIPVVRRHGDRQGGQRGGRESGHRSRSFRSVRSRTLTRHRTKNVTAANARTAVGGKRIGHAPDCIESLWSAGHCGGGSRPAAPGIRTSAASELGRLPGRHSRSAASMLAREPRSTPARCAAARACGVVRSGASTTAGRISRSAAA